jgi:hypothetical protein
LKRGIDRISAPNLLSKKQKGITMILKQYRLIILLVVFMIGLSITGWAISTHYDKTPIYGELQNELMSKSEIGNTESAEFSNNSTILFLISIGLIGLFGVRRRRTIVNYQSKKMEF